MPNSRTRRVFSRALWVFKKAELKADHAVADADMRLNIFMFRRVLFNLFAEGGHKDPKGLSIGFKGVDPYLIQNIVVGENLAHILGEQAQELVFNWSEVHFFIIDIDKTGAVVDFQAPVDKNSANSSSILKGLVR